MVGHEVLREPEFSRDDVAHLLAFLEERADMGPHGIPMSRATARDAKFVADREPIHDKAAKAIAREQKRYYEANPDAIRDGDIWTVREVTE